MKIIQGSNAPIVLEFDDSVLNVASMSIGIYSVSGTNVKQWGKDDCQISDDGKTVTCNLDQTDTASLDRGSYILSVKLMTEDGAIILYDEESIVVSMRKDKEVIL